MTSAAPADEPKEDSGLYRLEYLWQSGLGLAVLALIALILAQFSGVPTAIGIGTLIALAAGTVGAILGFLFAIPRVLSNEPSGSSNASTTSAVTGKPLLASNTNLERVSDWLTTMLVGVGLTQLAQIDAALTRFREFLRTSVHVCADGSAGSLPTVGPMLAIFGVIVGFTAMYLLTRLKLSKLFQRVEWDLTATVPADRVAGVKQVVAQATAGSGASENPFVRAVLDSSQPSIDDSLNLMFNLLYQKDGYQKVIDLAGQLVNTSAAKRADYWFYLAAAFGQKHHVALESKPPDQDAIQSAFDNAMDCARRAVAIDPAYKGRLLSIAQAGTVEDDLADFIDAPQFQAIVSPKT